MSIYKKIILLCAEQVPKLSISQLEKNCGLTTNIVQKWDKSSPTIEKLQKVADYFNVSLDYFIKDNMTKNSVGAYNGQSAAARGNDNYYVNLPFVKNVEIGEIEIALLEICKTLTTMEKIELVNFAKKIKGRSDCF